MPTIVLRRAENELKDDLRWVGYEVSPIEKKYIQFSPEQI
jgi:hypothetical protein